MEPFIAQIVMFGGNFAPRGWAFCDGQLLSINQNQALFSILGTTYGGDGRTTFALPDLRGRVAMHRGNGPGLSSYSLGQRGGAETVRLTQHEMPSHTHAVHGTTATADSRDPNGKLLAKEATGSTAIYGSGAPVNMDNNALANTGANVAHENRPPFICVNFIIALVGTFPSRN